MIFTQRYERTVDRDNTVSFYNVVMQLERAEWRPTLAGCKVIIHQHLDQTLNPHDRRTSRRSLQRRRKAVDAADQKQIQGRGKDVGRKSSSPSPTCKSRTQRGIRTFPPPLRLLTYETGHFTCYEKRTFLLANDISGWAVIQPL